MDLKKTLCVCVCDSVYKAKVIISAKISYSVSSAACWVNDQISGQCLNKCLNCIKLIKRMVSSCFPFLLIKNKNTASSGNKINGLLPRTEQW